jgi:hypothetical protein
LTVAISASSESINAPAAVTLVASVTSAPSSTLINVLTCAAEPDTNPCPFKKATSTSDPDAPPIHLLLVPSHNRDPEAGPLASLTCKPPKAAPVPFNATILSPISKVEEEIVVCVPLTSKLPVNTKLANVTASPVCSPKSTAVATPLVVSVAVP